MPDAREVKAVAVADIDLAGHIPGAFEIRDLRPTYDSLGMAFICPCGCGSESYMPMREGASDSFHWGWDGNRDLPTLTPSVFQKGMPCQWHGYLVAGIWRSC